PGPSFVAQPFPDQPFPEQPFTEQPFTAPYGSTQPSYPPFAPGVPLPTGPAVSPVPPPAARRGVPPATGPEEQFVPGLSASDAIRTDRILPPDIVASRTGTSGNDLVLASLCAQGHPNRPGSARCRVCGNSVDNAGPRLVQRPVLAQLVTAQGARVDVRGTVLVGRAPQAKPGDENVALLPVPSPNSDISRTHVMVAVHDWDVVATDLHSTNGTMLVRPGQPPVRMMPGAPVTVEPGTVLDLGDGGVITVGLPS
ncbi:MAG TPA: FHA domain-containing protein, partial [Propionibacteriaceae bacterium]|nr:FHA domain-containing protein [Propionibacteriaceae bacterium]